MRIVEATLIKKATDDGLMEFIDEVELGRKYRIDLDSMAFYSMYNKEQEKYHTKAMVMDVEEGAPLPTECLMWEGKLSSDSN